MLSKKKKIIFGALSVIVIIILISAFSSQNSNQINPSGSFKKSVDSSLTTNREKWDSVDSLPTDLALELMDFSNLLASFGNYKTIRKFNDFCPPVFTEIEILTNDNGVNKKVIYTFYDSKNSDAKSIGYMEVFREDNPYDEIGYLIYQRDDCNLNVEIKGYKTTEIRDGNKVVMDRQTLRIV